MKNRLFANFSKDITFNIIASFLSTGVMQLVVYPRLAIKLNSVDYGVMLTVMGYVNVITLTLGNNLCNARLLQQRKYTEKGIVGDFQILVLLAALISGIAISLGNLVIKMPPFLLFGVIITTIVTVLKSYYLVTYRIEINYKRNLLANLFMSAGYIIGATIIIKILPWPWIFTLSGVMGLLYIWNSSNIMREPFIRTKELKKTVKIVTVLAISGMIGNLTTYLDRFIIYPVLGGESVSIYVTASFFAKSLTLILSPITSVLLSYLVSNRLVVDRKRYTYINLALIGAGILSLFITMTIGKYVTALLYPTLIGEASMYVLYASVGIIIDIIGSFSGIVVLAYAPVYWQTIVPTIRLAIYLVLGIIMIKDNGIIGLCYGVIIANSISVLCYFVVGYSHVKKLKLVNA